MNRANVMKAIVVVAVISLLLIGYNLMKGRAASVAPSLPST